MPRRDDVLGAKAALREEAWSAIEAAGANIECRRRGRRPAPGVRWDELSDEKIAAIPLLSRLRP